MSAVCELFLIFCAQKSHAKHEGSLLYEKKRSFSDMFHFQLKMGREQLGLRASRMDIQIILFCSEKSLQS